MFPQQEFVQLQTLQPQPGQPVGKLQEPILGQEPEVVLQLGQTAANSHTQKQVIAVFHARAPGQHLSEVQVLSQDLEQTSLTQTVTPEQSRKLSVQGVEITKM
jgi:hypothetical protein